MWARCWLSDPLRRRPGWDLTHQVICCPLLSLLLLSLCSFNGTRCTTSWCSWTRRSLSLPPAWTSSCLPCTGCRRWCCRWTADGVYAMHGSRVMIPRLDG